ncbi:hypothetical protein PVAND_008876 [Polypedilum vanderplanki]|uniref:Rhophilin-2-like protein n=1 Tax=Polypedilum vanderplanki TaxID=319348 RepID=A0A9J6CB60_POLVA|nr:hypothetical protein PVAND_008876 [Polypedilum vanderplanki]
MDITDKSYTFKRGCDPTRITTRAKLQNRRCKLNQEINKELRLRSGAENLYKATSNKKLREKVTLELSFMNSTLQLLKEQLAELNSAVDVYEHDEKHEEYLPMISLGLKETKEVDFFEQFSDFILEHYSVEPSNFEDAILDLIDTRQASRTPTRDKNGVELLCKYYNLLYYAERRFFPADRNIGLWFEWFDSLTGEPSCQKTIALEKASILFNIAALHTQIGARKDRTKVDELNKAVDCFLKAAGIFQHITETFTNAPSCDLKPHVLEIFVQLMRAQAHECVFKRLQMENSCEYDILLTESHCLMKEYNKIHYNIQCNGINLPACWEALVPLKTEYFKALSHVYFAKHLAKNESRKNDVMIATAVDEKNRLKIIKAHLQQSQSSHEEILRIQRMSRELRTKIKISKVLGDLAELICNEMYTIPENINDDDGDIADTIIKDMPSNFNLMNIAPDFGKVEDPFRELGPIAIFSARRTWTAPRSVRLHKTDYQTKNHGTEEFGFSIKSESPVMISHVDINSVADLGGLKVGDYIVEIGDQDAKYFTQAQVLEKIRTSNNTLDLKIITPMLYTNKPSLNSDLIEKSFINHLSDTTSSSGVSSGASSPTNTNKLLKARFSNVWKSLKTNSIQRKFFQ